MKMYDRVVHHFYWPCLKQDVGQFTNVCHKCQVIGKPNRIIKPAPLCPSPSGGKAFEHLIVNTVVLLLLLGRTQSGTLWFRLQVCHVDLLELCVCRPSLTAYFSMETSFLFKLFFEVHLIVCIFQKNNTWKPHVVHHHALFLRWVTWSL